MGSIKENTEKIVEKNVIENILFMLRIFVFSYRNTFIIIRLEYSGIKCNVKASMELVGCIKFSDKR